MENSIDAAGLTIFLAQLIFVSLIVERNVAQIKKIITVGLERPWPLISTGISALIVYGAGLPLIPIITGMSINPIIDGAILSLWIAGGASGIVDTIKDASRKREEIHQTKIK